MATTKKARRPATRKKTASKRTKGNVSLDRLDKSLDSAQKALAEVRKDLSRGGHDLLKDLQKRIGDTRRDARGLTKSLRAELEQLGRTAKRRAGAGKKAPTRKRASRSAGTKKTAARKKTTRKRATRK